MKNRFFGAIFLIVGTTMGAAMLALPMVTAQLPFEQTMGYYLLVWALTTLSALMLLEVNLWFPSGSNLITMARGVLGPAGEWLAWLFYTLLLYTLLSAYISASSELVAQVLSIGLSPSVIPVLSPIIVVGFFGLIVYRGINVTDWVNRLFITLKLMIFMILVYMMSPYVNLSLLSAEQGQSYGGALMIIVTAFGYSIVIPTLRRYLDSDVSQLRIVILIGSLLPLCLYLIWVGVVQSVLLASSKEVVANLLSASQPTQALIAVLGQVSQHAFFGLLANAFVTLCIVTSLLGVAISLAHYLEDGFNLYHQRYARLIRTMLTFAPPLVVVLFMPAVFIWGLQFAGVSCIVLLITLPVCMLLVGRYKWHYRGPMRLWGGKFLPLLHLGLLAYFLFLLA